MLSEIRNGVPIGRPSASSVIESKNWPSALQFREQVSEVIRADLKTGKLLGPLYPSFPSYIVSPLAAFLKCDGRKIRLIHDLSYPFEGSVNASIDPESSSILFCR